MALGRAFSVAVRGLDGHIVEIEADITSGLPGVHLVGLPDAALQESRDRVRAAITNCGNSWPMARLTLALSPATLPKMGSVYDIALALAVILAISARVSSAAAAQQASALATLPLIVIAYGVSSNTLFRGSGVAFFIGGLAWVAAIFALWRASKAVSRERLLGMGAA